MAVEGEEDAGEAEHETEHGRDPIPTGEVELKGNKIDSSSIKNFHKQRYLGPTAEEGHKHRGEQSGSSGD